VVRDKEAGGGGEGERGAAKHPYFGGEKRGAAKHPYFGGEKRGRPSIRTLVGKKEGGLGSDEAEATEGAPAAAKAVRVKGKG